MISTAARDLQLQAAQVVIDRLGSHTGPSHTAAGAAVICVCDTPALVTSALDELQERAEVAFSSEGAAVSRSGSLALIQVSGTTLEPAEVYLFDVQSLGAKAFSTASADGQTTLRTLLESSKVLKVTYDCRTDSDALYHQFGVTLSNVLDVQVLCQAVSSQLGRVYHGPGQEPYVQGMKERCQEYLDLGTCRQLGVLGRSSSGAAMQVGKGHAWAQRPLSEDAQSAAASACQCIAHLCAEMRKRHLGEAVMRRVMARSEVYTRQFRSYHRELVWPDDKLEILLEKPL